MEDSSSTTDSTHVNILLYYLCCKCCVCRSHNHRRLRKKEPSQDRMSPLQTYTVEDVYSHEESDASLREDASLRRRPGSVSFIAARAKMSTTSLPDAAVAGTSGTPSKVPATPSQPKPGKTVAPPPTKASPIAKKSSSGSKKVVFSDKTHAQSPPRDDHSVSAESSALDLKKSSLSRFSSMYLPGSLMKIAHSNEELETQPSTSKTELSSKSSHENIYTKKSVTIKVPEKKVTKEKLPAPPEPVPILKSNLKKAAVVEEVKEDEKTTTCWCIKSKRRKEKPPVKKHNSFDIDPTVKGDPAMRFGNILFPIVVKRKRDGSRCLLEMDANGTNNVCCPKPEKKKTKQRKKKKKKDMKGVDADDEKSLKKLASPRTSNLEDSGNIQVDVEDKDANSAWETEEIVNTVNYSTGSSQFKYKQPSEESKQKVGDGVSFKRLCHAQNIQKQALGSTLSWVLAVLAPDVTTSSDSVGVDASTQTVKSDFMETTSSSEVVGYMFNFDSNRPRHVDPTTTVFVFGYEQSELPDEESETSVLSVTYDPVQAWGGASDDKLMVFTGSEEKEEGSSVGSNSRSDSLRGDVNRGRVSSTSPRQIVRERRDLGKVSSTRTSKKELPKRIVRERSDLGKVSSTRTSKKELPKRIVRERSDLGKVSSTRTSKKDLPRQIVRERSDLGKVSSARTSKKELPRQIFRERSDLGKLSSTRTLKKELPKKKR